MSAYLWRKYFDYLLTRRDKAYLFEVMLEPYKRPKSFTRFAAIYASAFYTGIIGSALTEQLYKEKYWEEHPGHEVPLMLPLFYWGPWKVYRGQVPRHEPPPE